MNKNEFVLVFQYDEDQAGTRSPDKRITRAVEAQGGAVTDISEAYGMVDITCSFSGTPEQAQKLGNDILNSYQQQNIKISQNIRQTYYTLTAENVNQDDTDFMKNLKDLVRTSPMGKVVQDEFNPNNIVIRIAVKDDYDQLKTPILDMLQKNIPNVKTFEEIDNRTMFEGNNYSDKKKNTV